MKVRFPMFARCKHTNSSVLGENKFYHCLIHYFIQRMFIEGQLCTDIMNHEDIIKDTI